MSAGTDLYGDVLEALRENGHAVELRSITSQGAYNSTTGIVTGQATTDTVGTGLFLPYMVREIDGTRIRADDRRCILSPDGFGAVPTTGDILVDLDGKEFRILDVEKYRLNDVIVALICHCRTV